MIFDPREKGGMIPGEKGREGEERKGEWGRDICQDEDLETPRWDSELKSRNLLKVNSNQDGGRVKIVMMGRWENA